MRDKIKSFMRTILSNTHAVVITILAAFAALVAFLVVFPVVMFWFLLSFLCVLVYTFLYVVVNEIKDHS